MTPFIASSDLKPISVTIGVHFLVPLDEPTPPFSLKLLHALRNEGLNITPATATGEFRHALVTTDQKMQLLYNRHLIRLDTQHLDQEKNLRRMAKAAVACHLDHYKLEYSGLKLIGQECAYGLEWLDSLRPEEYITTRLLDLPDEARANELVIQLNWHLNAFNHTLRCHSAQKTDDRATTNTLLITLDINQADQSGVITRSTFDDTMRYVDAHRQAFVATRLNALFRAGDSSRNADR